MMRARNIVLNGVYKGRAIDGNGKGYAMIRLGLFRKIDLTRENVLSWERVGGLTGSTVGASGGAASVGDHKDPAGAPGSRAIHRQKGMEHLLLYYQGGGCSLLEVDDWLCQLITDALPMAPRQEPVRPAAQEPMTTATFSVAEEIGKFQKLLQEGVITQQEFDTRKRKLLQM